MDTKAPAGGPLSHIKVLDLTLARAAPTAVRQLADMGSDVVQVVRPGSEAGGEQLNSDRENLHRNKRSLLLDLQRDEGREVFYRLVPQFDVVVENFRPEVKHRLRVDFETLARSNPRLVYGSISGFGQDGPYGDRGGLDQIAQGIGGLMSVTGPPGGGPWRVGIPISDLCAGLFLAQGIMAALLERERSGRGQWVNTSLLEAMIAMLDFQATRWLIDGVVPPQAGNDHPTFFPMGVFATKDGYLNIGASGGRLYDRFIDAIGSDGIFDDPRFADPRSRNAHREELRAVCETKLRLRTTAEWVEALNAVGVPSGPVLSIDETFADPQVEHLAMAQTVAHPIHGDLRVVRSPVNLSRTPASLRSAAPLPGADTAAVLRENGFSEAEVDALREAGIAGASREAVGVGRADSLFG